MNLFIENVSSIPSLLDLLGIRLKQMRIAKGWSVAELAQRSGVSQSTIKRCERTGIITSDRLLQLLMSLGQTEAFMAGLADKNHWTLEQHERLNKKELAEV